MGLWVGPWAWFGADHGVGIDEQAWSGAGGAAAAAQQESREQVAERAEGEAEAAMGSSDGPDNEMLLLQEALALPMKMSRRGYRKRRRRCAWRSSARIDRRQGGGASPTTT